MYEIEGWGGEGDIKKREMAWEREREGEWERENIQAHKAFPNRSSVRSATQGKQSRLWRTFFWLARLLPLMITHTWTQSNISSTSALQPRKSRGKWRTFSQWKIDFLLRNIRGFYRTFYVILFDENVTWTWLSLCVAVPFWEFPIFTGCLPSFW
jgi:hypothetical protein